VIKIRYSTELGPGLNGQAERRGRGIVVYLLPWLTSDQRTATLRRLSQQGRVGIGPRLPAVQLTLALLADRVRTVFARAGAVVRIHPAGSALPIMMVSAAAVTFLLLSPVSIRIVHQPQAVGGPAFGAAPARAGQPSTTAVPGTSRSQQPASGTGIGSPGAGQPGNGTVPGAAPAPGASPSPVTGPSPSTDPSTDPTTGAGGVTLTSTAATTAPTQPPATLAPAASPSPAPLVTLPALPTTLPSLPEPTPSATASTPAGQACVEVGSLDICLKL
jgi:hypothetical protein